MKRIALFVLSLAVASPVFAQTMLTPSSTMKRMMNLRETINAKRMEMKDAVERHKEDFKAEAEKIRDAAKRKIAEGVNDKLQKLNENRGDHFGNVVDKLTNVLSRIKARTEKAAARGLDVSAVRTAIADAEKAIADAKAAALAQAGKTYTITITGETGLKGAMRKVRDALHTDVMTVREAVKKAHEAVRKAATTLAKIHGVDDDFKNGTSTGRGDNDHRPTSTNP